MECTPSTLQLPSTDEVDLETIQSVTGQWTRALEWEEFAKFWTGQNRELTSSLSFPYVLDMNMGVARTQNPTFNNMGRRMLVTKSFQKLYERIKYQLKLDIIRLSSGIPERPPVLKDVIITGQPGSGMLFTQILLCSTHQPAGKSISLWFLAIRLLQDYPTEPLIIIQPWGTLLFYRRSCFFLRSVNNSS